MHQPGVATYHSGTHPGLPAHLPEDSPIKLIVLGVCLLAVLSAGALSPAPGESTRAAVAPTVEAAPSDSPPPNDVVWATDTSVPPSRSLDEPTRLEAAAAAREAAHASDVFSSYYGPGLYGHRTACGQILTAGVLGVAHRSLPCGTPVTLQYGSATLTVPVIDRGPYVLSRVFDLTYATKVALGCPDLCRLAWLH